MFNRLWNAKALWLRVLFCWVLGSILPFYDEADNYDQRFRLRGVQEVSSDIVLIQLDQADWNAFHGPTENYLRALKEFAVPNDSFFWKASTWDKLLENVLAQDPRAVGITFFFSQQLPPIESRYSNIYDPRVIWAGQLDSEGRTVMPLAANSYGYNVALTELREDEDRTLRRFSPPIGPLPHMGLKLLETAEESNGQQFNAFLGETKIINFRGPRSVFRSVSALDVLKGHIPAGFFKNKIVIVGSSSLPSHQFQTPVGRMNRAEVLAQITDNAKAKRWIERISPWGSSLYILAILLVAVGILTTYPQTVAFVFLFWLGLGSTAFSLWVFDQWYLWLPAVSPLITLLIAYVILIGYQLAQKENQTWRLQQEKQLLSELDQLRNNFVSLISHDLKTPIAKIQAICDRLLAGQVNEDVREGLGSLRKESVELHRYIQSILQISRLESNSVQLRKEATDLNEVVEKVVGQVGALAADKRQDLHVDLEPMFSIEVDSIMIQEVVLNLVENAIKYTPNDGHIEVKTTEVDDKVIFAVRDNGPGIPPTDREHIFEKFFRGQAVQSHIKGTGLGLFLVKYFVELHGGEVFLESDIGKGTRVGFTLPLQA